MTPCSLILAFALAHLGIFALAAWWSGLDVALGVTRRGRRR
jgi:hypothetical protein